jgi:hypothetical protein
MPDILERGNIYFAFRPRVDESVASGFEDVQRFFMILSPHGKKRYRLIAPSVGLGEQQQPVFPAKLEAHFRGRRFAPADLPTS